jgi:hypothetical protein
MPEFRTRRRRLAVLAMMYKNVELSSGLTVLPFMARGKHASGAVGDCVDGLIGHEGLDYGPPALPMQGGDQDIRADSRIVQHLVQPDLLRCRRPAELLALPSNQAQVTAGWPP